MEAVGGFFFGICRAPCREQLLAAFFRLKADLSNHQMIIIMKKPQWQKQVIRFFEHSSIKSRFVEAYPNGTYSGSAICYDPSALGSDRKAAIRRCRSLLRSQNIPFGEVSFFEAWGKPGNALVIQPPPKSIRRS